jgi:hypothetical protein
MATSAATASFQASERFFSPGRPSGLMNCTAMAAMIRSEKALVMLEA